MASVTFPEALGGNGQTYTDDADPNTGLDGLGYTIRFIPCLQQAVAMGLSAKNDAQAADGFVQQCQTLRQETATDRQAVAEDRVAVEQHLQDAQARIGTTQALIDARDTALAAQADAEDAETGAVAAQTSAEAARDAAVVSGQVYPDTSAGLTATSDGQYFKTVAANQAGFLTLWRNNAGVATEIETYPSLTGIAQALEQANRKQTRLARSLQRLGDHGQTLHSDFDLDAYGLGNPFVGGVQDAMEVEELWDVERLSGTYALQHVADGSLKYVEVPTNTLAREWNPETGKYQAQISGAVTNEVRYSSDQTNPAWNSSGVDRESSSESVIAGKFPTKITQDISAGNHEVRQSFNSPASNSKYTFFSIIKNDGAQEVRLLFTSDLTGSFPNVTYNYSTQSLTSANADDAGIVNLSNGYSLIYFTVTSSASPSSFTYYIRMRKDGQDSFTGDGESGIYIAHAQLVRSTSYAPLIVTESAPVTRAADNVSRQLGAEFNGSEGTWVVRFTNKNPPLLGTVFSTHILQLKDNSAPDSVGRNLLLQSRNRSDNLRLLWTPKGATEGFAGSLILANGILSGVMAVSYKMGSVIKGCANGGDVVSDDQSPPDFAITNSFLAPYDLQDVGYEVIEYIPSLVTDEKLQELTQ